MKNISKLFLLIILIILNSNIALGLDARLEGEQENCRKIDINNKKEGAKCFTELALRNNDIRLCPPVYYYAEPRDSCKTIFLIEKGAVKNKDTSVCMTLEREQKEGCILIIAKESKDINLCKLIEPDIDLSTAYYRECLISLVATKEDINMCDAIVINDEYRDYCKLVANEALSKKMIDERENCRKIDQNNNKEGIKCLTDFALRNNDISLCWTAYFHLESIDSCMANFLIEKGAVKNKDTSFCMVQEQTRKESCISVVAKESKDINLCKLIKPDNGVSAIMYRECITPLVTTEEDIKLCDAIVTDEDRQYCKIVVSGAFGEKLISKNDSSSCDLISNFDPNSEYYKRKCFFETSFDLGVFFSNWDYFYFWIRLFFYRLLFSLWPTLVAIPFLYFRQIYKKRTSLLTRIGLISGAIFLLCYFLGIVTGGWAFLWFAPIMTITLALCIAGSLGELYQINKKLTFFLYVVIFGVVVFGYLSTELVEDFSTALGIPGYFKIGVPTIFGLLLIIYLWTVDNLYKKKSAGLFISPVNVKLLEYIKAQMDSGANAEVIKNNLIAQGGWTETDIKEVFRYLEGEKVN